MIEKGRGRDVGFLSEFFATPPIGRLPSPKPPTLWLGILLYIERLLDDLRAHIVWAERETARLHLVIRDREQTWTDQIDFMEEYHSVARALVDRADLLTGTMQPGVPIPRATRR